MVLLNRGKAVNAAVRSLRAFQSDVKTLNSTTLSQDICKINFERKRNDDSMHLKSDLLPTKNHIFNRDKNDSPSHRRFSTSTYAYDVETTSSPNDELKPVYDTKKKMLRKKSTFQSKAPEQKSENKKIVNELLCLDINRKGRGYLDQNLSIFSKIQQNEKCTPKDALMLLKLCAFYITDETPAIRSNLSERLWKYFIDSGVQMNSSHYNTLLNTRLENRMPEFDPSEFISTMKENGVEPDRVTYQHLIAKFCSIGDIQGASSMLELMKQHQMPITKYVFHSLIIGHSRDNDFEGVKSVINVMINSGLEVTGETKMIYIVELAKAGKNFKQELEKIIEEGQRFLDKDYFKLMVSLLENNQKEAASDIVKMLPMNIGFYQEMRTFFPSLIAAGGLELSYKVHEKFLSHQSEENISTKRDILEDNGQFLVRASIKHRSDPKELVHYLEKQNGSSPTPDEYSRLLEHCVDLDSIVYGQQIHNEIIKRYYKNIDLIPGDGYLVHHMARLRTQSMVSSDISSDIVQFLIKLGAVGLSTRVYQLSKIIIPNVLEGTETTPDDFLRMYHNALKELENTGIRSRASVPINLIANSMFRYYLGRENNESFENAVQLLFTRKDLMRPHFWNLPLARSFLRTQSQNALITVLSLCSSSFKFSKKNDTEDQLVKKDADLFRTLNHIVIHSTNYHPDKKPAEILLPVLKELVSLKIGVPGIVIGELKTTLTSRNDDLTNLLMQLEGNYLKQKEIWVKEAIVKFYESRRKLHKNNFETNKLSGFIPISKRKINRYID